MNDIVSFRWRYWSKPKLHSYGETAGWWVSETFDAPAGSNLGVRAALEKMWFDYQSRDDHMITGEFQVHETFDSDDVWVDLDVETVLLYLLGA